ncbi:MAG: ATP synthase subunit C [Erysipelotrichaceae bacterium]
MSWIQFVLPAMAIVVIMLPLVKVFQGRVNRISAKRRLVTHVGLFFSAVFAILMINFAFGGVFAAEETVSIVGTNAQGMGFLAAALSAGLSALGAGIAVASAAPAAIGSFSENEKNFSKALIFVALGEGVAIYGLLIAILIINSL